MPNPPRRPQPWEMPLADYIGSARIMEPEGRYAPETLEEVGASILANMSGKARGWAPETNPDWPGITFCVKRGLIMAFDGDDRPIAWFGEPMPYVVPDWRGRKLSAELYRISEAAGKRMPVYAYSPSGLLARIAAHALHVGRAQRDGKALPGEVMADYLVSEAAPPVLRPEARDRILTGKGLAAVPGYDAKNGRPAEALTRMIAAVRDRYHHAGRSDWDIGNGLCEDFAHDVLEAWAGADWRRREWGDGRWGTLETANLMTVEDEWDWPLIENRYGSALDGLDRTIIDRIARIGPSHVWIEFEGRCFDCEHPEGVESPFALEFFRRWSGLMAEPVPSPG